MRLLFIIDGRSPIALNWVEYFLKAGQEVHLVSTYPCYEEARYASFNFVPVAFSQFKQGSIAKPGVLKPEARGFWGASQVGVRTKIRQWLGPFTLIPAAKRLKRIIDTIKPDLIHAMRIPYEGMLAALANPSARLLVSVWGNDFTLHAKSTILMSYFTRLALRRADALHTDCLRDMQLAEDWGFFMKKPKPSIVVPGAGGVQPDIFYPPVEEAASDTKKRPQFSVINPRGFRAYVRNDTFFKAIPLVLAQKPDTKFVCPNMFGEVFANEWVEKLGLSNSVELLPFQSRQEMADLFRSCQIVVSPSIHDGTPNTLLEAMACGCFPIAGDIKSIREWIISGDNGLLVNPEDPDSIAQAIVRALADKEFLRDAKKTNLRQIKERALYPIVMKKVDEFYQSLISSNLSKKSKEI